jgi:sterol 3beta-glucosyltransferase
VAPFTGLAAAVRAAGHSVMITGNDEWEGLVRGCGLEFRPLPGTRACLMTQGGCRGGGGPASAVRLIRLMGEHMRTLHKAVLAVARQDPADVLALTGMTTLGGYHVAEGLGMPGMGLVVQPLRTTADFPPSFVSDRSFGRVGNRVAGTAAATTLALGMAGPARQIRRELGLARRGTREAVTGQPDARRWPVADYH